jgi:hypothetical protein
MTAMLFVIVLYLVLILGSLSGAGAFILAGALPDWAAPMQLAFLCALIGGAGGCVYCLRGIYIHRCVEKNWNSDWYAWYFIRPLVSVVCGGVSFIFLKAGLLILESRQQEGSTEIGFYALAFIAGLNVDKFIAKIEDVSQAVWGIEKSRAAKNASQDKQ